ncbi:MAG: hypothetical protein KBD51_02710 [Candidatus Levybacteria bacterium]|nr:hypothetical protein [Candidatus Levybacteria bacterium]
MANVENKNVLRVGLLGASTFAILAGGATALSSAHEFWRLQGEQIKAGINTPTSTNENPNTPVMRQSLDHAVVGGVVFVAGSALAVGTAVSVIQSGRRRPGFENTDLVEPQQEG